MDESLKNKRVLVVGMARSGLAAAKLLCQLGATAVLSDNKTEIDGIDELAKLGCEARLGEPAESLVEGCDAVVVSPAVWYNAPVILKAQELGVPVMSELDFAFRHCPGNKFAVSGTNAAEETATLCANADALSRQASARSRTKNFFSILVISLLLLSGGNRAGGEEIVLSFFAGYGIIREPITAQ